MRLDDLGRCCGRKPIIYKRDKYRFCDRCSRAFRLDRPEQIANWAWRWSTNKADFVPIKEHYLKTWPTYFDAIQRGEKTFEGRKNDRKFAEGDTVILRRTISDQDWNIDATAPELRFQIGFVLHGGQFGIQDGYCVFSLLPEVAK